jgi:hypothetical protein
MIACTAVAFFMDYFSLNDPNDREYAIWDDQRIIDWDMVEAAKLQLLQSEEGQSIPVRSEKMSKLTSVILYKGAEAESSMTEKRILEKIQRLEDDILSMPEWKDLCWSKSGDDAQCNEKAMVSALSFLKVQGIDDLKAAT